MRPSLDRRPHPPVGGWAVGLLVSAVLVSVGVGIGLPWVAEAGWSGVAVLVYLLAIPLAASDPAPLGDSERARAPAWRGGGTGTTT